MIWLALSLAQASAGSITIVGDSNVSAPLAAALQSTKRVGPCTVISTSEHGGAIALQRGLIDQTVRRAGREGPTTVLIDFGENGADLFFDGIGLTPPGMFERRIKARAAYEPELADLLGRLVKLPSHPRVILLAPAAGDDVRGRRLQVASQPIIETFLIPLDSQAAREAGVEFVTLEGTTAAGRAEELIDLIAPHAAKAGWHIVRASSQQADEGPATNAIDGDPNTYWHTQYDPTIAKPPHELVIDLGQTIWLAGFRYTPRQDGGDNGIARDYELYVGDSPDAQTILAAKGTFKRGADRKSVRFTQPFQGRYLRFVILSAQNRQPYGSAAEIDIIRDHTHE